jgi:CheY-like chemotaxis protein
MAEVTAPAPAAPILLVEDDPTTVDVVRAYLEHEGHATAVCRSGGRRSTSCGRSLPVAWSWM